MYTRRHALMHFKYSQKRACAYCCIPIYMWLPSRSARTDGISCKTAAIQCMPQRSEATAWKCDGRLFQQNPPTHEKARWARVHVHLCRIASPAYLHWKKSFHRLLARHWNIELFDVRPQRRQQLKYASAHDDGVESNALRKAKSLIQFLHLIVFSFVRLFRLVENNSSRTLKDGIDLAS